MRRFLVFFLVACLALCVTAASAEAKAPTLKSLAKTVAALQQKVKRQGTTIAEHLTVSDGSHMATLDSSARANYGDASNFTVIVEVQGLVQ